MDGRLSSAPPPGVQPYRKTPIFDAETVPAALLADHNTKAGVWAVIHVLAGAVTFKLADRTIEKVIRPGSTLACPPERRHSVSLTEDARFQIEFWR